MYFGQVGPTSKHDTESIVEDRASFYSTFFATTRILPKKEEYKLSELKTQFEVHLRLACVEEENIFRAMLWMCTDYNMELTLYSKRGNPRSKSRMAITWLCPLKVLSNANI